MAPPLRMLATAAGALGSIYLGWLLLGILDWVRPPSPGPLVKGVLEAISASSLRYFAYFFLVPVALHAILWLQRARAPRLFFVSDLVVLLLVLNPAREHALYLTASEPNASAGAYAFGCALAFVALWRWHLLGCGPLPADERWAQRRRRLLPLWFIVTALSLFWVRSCALESYPLYPRSAQLLCFVGWVLAGSLVFAGLRLHARVNDVGVLLALLAALGLRNDVETTAPAIEDAPLLATAQHALAPKSPASPAHFDFSEPSRFKCARPGERSFSQELPIEADKRRNVILISVDALRERETRENYKRGPLMPNLQAFAKRSKVFDNAFTTYPATLPALGGALTGWFASELLYAPHFPSNVFARTREVVDVQQIVMPGFGWFQLDVVDDLLVQDTPTTHLKDAQKQVNYLLGRLSYLREHDKSLFAWVHFIEPRRPYQQRPGFKWGKKLRNRYRSEVAYTDAQLGRLFEALEEGGWFEDSLIIVFADHGEAQGERNYYGHHKFLNAWTMDIPLFVYFPGVQPAKVADTVQITDIFPTVLHWWGLSAPDDIEARSLFETIVDGRSRPAFAEAFAKRGRELYDRMGDRPQGLEAVSAGIVETAWAGTRDNEPKVAIVEGQERLIANRRSGEFELYNRLDDVREKRDQSDKEPIRLVELLDELRDWHFRMSERIYCRSLIDSR